MIFIYFLLGILIYGLSLGNGFVGDDAGLIVNNLLVHNLANIEAFFRGGNFFNNPGSSLSGIYYKPIFSTVLSLIYTIFGEQAFFFHAFQLLFHIVNATLIFLFFRRFFSSKTAAFLGAIFLVHPVNVEAVSYISAFQEVIFFLFGMLALLSFSKTPKLGYLLLLLSLLTKETGILFIFTLVLHQFIFDRKNFIKVITGGGIVLLIYLFLRFGVAGIYFNSDAISPMMRADLITRLITIPKILETYFLNLIFPIHLLSRQNWLVQRITFGDFYFPSIFVGGVFLALLLFGYKIRKTLVFKTYLFFLGCFGAGLLIHLQIFPLDCTIADRWFYFILFGFLGLGGIVWQHWKNKGAFLLIVIIFLFSLRSFYRSLDWKDDFTLASRDVVLNTDSFSLESSLGAILVRLGRYNEAKIHLEKSIKLFPTFLNWVNLAAMYEKMGDRRAAAGAYEEAFKYGNYYVSAESAVLNYLLLNDDEKAANLAGKKILIFKNDSLLWQYLAIARYRLGQKALALNAINQAIVLDPNAQSWYVKGAIENGQDIKFQ